MLETSFFVLPEHWSIQRICCIGPMFQGRFQARSSFKARTPLRRTSSVLVGCERRVLYNFKSISVSAPSEALVTAPAYFRKASVPAIGKLTDDPEAVAKCTKAFTGRELYSEAMFVGEPAWEGENKPANSVSWPAAQRLAKMRFASSKVSFEPMSYHVPGTVQVKTGKRG